MNLIVAVTLIGTFLIAYIIIVEIFTVLFRLTGLTEEKAHMQVISMLTNSGFTTTESEIIMTSKKRRKLARITMLFGYSITVIVVSIMLNFFISLNQVELRTAVISALVLGTIVIILFISTKIKWVKIRFDHIIERIGNRVMFGKSSNTMVVIDNYGAAVMAEIFLKHLPPLLSDVKLVDSNLKEKYQLQILLIKRDGRTLEKINGETIVKKNDLVVLFGPKKYVREIFENPTS